MNWRSKLGILVLTREEQRTIAFIVFALVLGLATMHYRHTHSRPAPAPNENSTTASPSPPATIR
jgi:hypothetical protein